MERTALTAGKNGSFSCLEVHTDVDEEVAGAGCVEVVLANVGEAYVEAQFGIEHLILGAAADAQSAVEAVVVVKGAVRLADAVVLRLAADAVGQIAADEGLDVQVVVDIEGVFDGDGYLQIAKAGGLLVTAGAGLAAFL